MRRKKLRRTDSPSTSCFRQSELQSIFMRMRLFAARPRRFGNHAGRLLDRKPFTGSPGGLADYNPRSASPSDVWADDIAYHCSPARSPGEKAVRGLFPVKNTRSDPVRIIFACFPCHPSGRERTRMAGIRLSSSERTAFLTRSLYSRWERGKYNARQKYFFNFFLRR